LQVEYIIQPQTKQLLISLAQKYEIATFTKEDPSQFIRWYSSPEDVEVASFIAAMLSFGSRKQFIPKIRYIFELADKAGGMAAWLKNGQYKKDFQCSDCKFYRFYSYSDMLELFFALESVLKEHSTLGLAIQKFCDSRSGEHTVSDSTMDFFRTYFVRAAIVPKGKNSANKRIHMFLRWMVRQNSPVDLGLWSWYPAASLLIPLDTHVMQEAQKLGLLPEKSTASRKSAILLTKKMEEIFPGDPTRADYALFGLGVDENN